MLIPPLPTVLLPRHRDNRHIQVLGSRTAGGGKAMYGRDLDTFDFQANQEDENVSGSSCVEQEIALTLFSRSSHQFGQVFSMQCFSSMVLHHSSKDAKHHRDMTVIVAVHTRTLLQIGEWLAIHIGQLEGLNTHS